MIVDQDAHPPHHLPSRSRHGSGTACHDRQALVPPWAPLAHAFAHSRSDGHQAQPEGLETIPSRSAQCWHLPREARSRLERSVEASIGHVSRAAGCHMPGSALAATARDQTSGGGAKYGKVRPRCLFSDRITKNRSSQPSFLHSRWKGPKWSYQPCHPRSLPRRMADADEEISMKANQNVAMDTHEIAMTGFRVSQYRPASTMRST